MAWLPLTPDTCWTWSHIVPGAHHQLVRLDQTNQQQQYCATLHTNDQVKTTSTVQTVQLGCINLLDVIHTGRFTVLLLQLKF